MYPVKLSHFQKTTLSICLCSILTFANIYWLQPLLPLLQQRFALDSMQANLAMSAPLLGMAGGLLLFASWSDAIGRRQILLIGSGLGVVISLLLPICEHYPIFLVLRLLQGFCFSACPAVAVPLLSDELRKNWLPAAVGFYIASNTVGGLASRLIAGTGATITSSWEGPAALIAAISLLLYVAVHTLMPRQRRFTSSSYSLSAALHGFSRHLQQPTLLAIYLIIGIAFGSFVNISNYLMLVLESDFNLPSELRSLMFLTLLGGTLSSSLAGKYAKRHRLLTGIMLGLGIMLTGNLLLMSQQILLMVLAMVLLSIGFFFCHAQANALIGQTVKKDKASAQALYSLFYYGGASLGVFVLEPFYQQQGWQGVLTATCCLLVVGIVIAGFEFMGLPHSFQLKRKG